MGCLHFENCKESKVALKGCWNPSAWKNCEVYKNLFFYEDLREI
jgi:hypothetical protein